MSHQKLNTQSVCQSILKSKVRILAGRTGVQIPPKDPPIKKTTNLLLNSIRCHSKVIQFTAKWIF